MSAPSTSSLSAELLSRVINVKYGCFTFFTFKRRTGVCIVKAVLIARCLHYRGIQKEISLRRLLYLLPYDRKLTLDAKIHVHLGCVNFGKY